MKNIFLLLTAIQFLFALNACGDEVQNKVWKLESYQKEDFSFAFKVLEKDKLLEKELRDVDPLKEGKTLKTFPFIGVKAYFLIERGEKKYILTMLQSRREYLKKTFHVTNAKSVKHNITDTEGTDYVRVFESEKLYDRLSKILDEKPNIEK